MKKALLIAAAAVCAMSVNAYAVNINIDGGLVSDEGKIESGQTFAPVRDILESLNYSVEWDGDTNSVNAVSNTGNEESAEQEEAEEPIFGLGQGMTMDTFTGGVYLNNLANEGGVSIVNVTFDEGCINDWHVHDHVQILMGTMGRGYCQQEGQEPELIEEGDIVVVPAGVKHWHGAAPNSAFTHISVSGQRVEGMEEFDTMWLEPVDQEEYARLS